MAFKPLHDRVLVRRVQSEDKTKGGLIIPDSAKEKPAEGEVVACGEGAVELLELQQEGRRVLPADAFLRGYPLRPGDRLS